MTTAVPGCNPARGGSLWPPFSSSFSFSDDIDAIGSYFPPPLEQTRIPRGRRPSLPPFFLLLNFRDERRGFSVMNAEKGDSCPSLQSMSKLSRSTRPPFSPFVISGFSSLVSTGALSPAMAHEVFFRRVTVFVFSYSEKRARTTQFFVQRELDRRVSFCRSGTSLFLGLRFSSFKDRPCVFRGYDETFCDRCFFSPSKKAPPSFCGDVIFPLKNRVDVFLFFFLLRDEDLREFAMIFLVHAWARSLVFWHLPLRAFSLRGPLPEK